MSTKADSLLQGTLDLLVLRVLGLKPHHGHGITVAVQARSGDTLTVDHGSLYPALRRLEKRGWIRGAGVVWKNTGRARFSSLTATGKRQLSAERGRWNRLVASISKVMGPDGTPEDG